MMRLLIIATCTASLAWGCGSSPKVPVGSKSMDALSDDEGGYGYTKVFMVTDEEQRSFNVSLGHEGFVAELTMSGTYRSVVKEIKQTARSKVFENFLQGKAGVAKIDMFDQDPIFPERSFPLSTIPDSGSIRVTVDGNFTTAWTVSGNRLTFNQAPNVNADIVVRYTNGSTLKTLFPFASSFDPTTAAVFINDKQVNATGFTVDSSNKVLRFSTTPPAEARIRMEAYAAMPLNRTFSIDAKDYKSLQAFVNDEKQEIESFSQNGVITLQDAPKDTDSVIFKYEELAEPTLSYPAPTLGATPKVLRSVASSGTESKVELVGGNFIVSKESFAPDGKILITYTSEMFENGTIRLPFNVAIDSVKVATTDSACAGKESINGLIVRFACEWSNVIPVSLSWMGVKQSFEVPLMKSAGRWVVAVDGVETLNFSSEPGFVTVWDTLNAGSTVTIKYLQ